MQNSSPSGEISGATHVGDFLPPEFHEYVDLSQLKWWIFVHYKNSVLDFEKTNIYSPIEERLGRM